MSRTHNIRRRADGSELHELELLGRRPPHTRKGKVQIAAPNSLRFLAEVEGIPEPDGRLRSANGMRWRLA